jgi:uncharacterized membrane protein YphA (DoxX/SURF4 family)
MTRRQEIAILTLRFAIGWRLFVEGYALWQGQVAGASLPQALAARPHLAAALGGAWAVAGFLVMAGLLTRGVSAVALLTLGFLVLASPVAHSQANACRLLEAVGLVVALAFDSGRVAGVDALLRLRSGAGNAPPGEADIRRGV